MFDKYKDPQQDAILVDGTEQLCEDLQVDPTHVSVLILAWYLECDTMCEFKRISSFSFILSRTRMDQWMV